MAAPQPNTKVCSLAPFPTMSPPIRGRVKAMSSAADIYSSEQFAKRPPVSLVWIFRRSCLIP
jgi:hypothetical protein